MTVEEVHALKRETRELGYPVVMLREISHMYRQYELAARWGMPDGPRFSDAVHWQQCADECDELISRKLAS